MDLTIEEWTYLLFMIGVVGLLFGGAIWLMDKCLRGESDEDIRD